MDHPWSKSPRAEDGEPVEKGQDEFDGTLAGAFGLYCACEFYTTHTEKEGSVKCLCRRAIVVSIFI
jgi:hypothetical protein